MALFEPLACHPHFLNSLIGSVLLPELFHHCQLSPILLLSGWSRQPLQKVRNFEVVQRSTVEAHSGEVTLDLEAYDTMQPRPCPKDRLADSWRHV